MNTVLQLSGGRDSLCLAWHMRAVWDYIMILHLDTGDMYASARAAVREIEREAPHFHRIQSDSPQYRWREGDPTNENWTKCCYNNIWFPMHQYCRKTNVRQIMRGTRRVDPHLHGVFPGDIVDGTLYTFPLWDWTDDQVNYALGDRLPLAYRLGADGMPDCRGCTATAACGMMDKRYWERVTTVAIGSDTGTL